MTSPGEPLPEAPATALPGTLIAERYRIESILGEGGMGIVYLAEHIHIRKRVALKVLLPRWTSTPEVVARFEREAVAAGAIDHPNVAAATDFGQLADGSFFLVLEYLEGRTLRSELEAGAIAPARALEIARGIALGVGAAHAKGIVHRDLKPENVMLIERDADPDFVKVLDFGIARISPAGVENGQALTSAGAVLGTPDYMAPEQILGTGVDLRADLYALGVMLFEMLSGECPFQGGTATLLRQHLLNEVPTLPPHVVLRVPGSVGGLVARLTQKDPALRFANATEVLAAIDAAHAELAPTSTIERARTVVAQARTSPGEGSLVKWVVSSAQRVMVRPRARAGALLVWLVAVVLVTAIGLRSGDVRIVEGKEAAPVAAPIVTAPRAQPSASTAQIEKPPDETLAPAPAPSAAPRKRKTGPGGIYIPPPSRWFN